MTAIGREMALGFSCFALRTLRMFGRWDALPEATREEWAQFLLSFQEPGGEGAFRDEAELRYISRPRSLATRVADRLRRRPALPGERALLLAETKQTIATLHEIGVDPKRPFTGFPTSPAEVRAWLDALDWGRPWGAGGQSGALILFLCTQAPRILPAEKVTEQLDVCRAFFAELADPESGAYFRGPRPAHGELINGAMKVLMSLDWLGVHPHYADRLIATCLEQPPQGRGCHLVDAIYVLHQSVLPLAERAVEHRAGMPGSPAGWKPAATGAAAPRSTTLERPVSDEVRRYCLNVFEQLRAHYHSTGGFSFFVGRSQDSYYGVPITAGRDEADVQGTCLLVWALAMIWRLVDPAKARWGVIKP